MDCEGQSCCACPCKKFCKDLPEDLRQVPCWKNIYLSTVALVDAILLWAIVFHSSIPVIVTFAMLLVGMLIAGFLKHNMVDNSIQCCCARLLFWKDGRSFNVLVIALFAIIIGAVFKPSCLALLTIFAGFAITPLYCHTKDNGIWSKIGQVPSKVMNTLNGVASPLLKRVKQ